MVIGGQTHYEVQRILDLRWHRRQLQYLIKWKGYFLSEASWVKSKNIQADRLVKRFHAENPTKPEFYTCTQFVFLFVLYRSPSRSKGSRMSTHKTFLCLF
uniref:Chromo domain-containing protein n=1 Tax=Micrurus corallinus TaxID=54390 RepID=A0A2D4FGQ6_MICCO